MDVSFLSMRMRMGVGVSVPVAVGALPPHVVVVAVEEEEAKRVKGQPSNPHIEEETRGHLDVCGERALSTGGEEIQEFFGRRKDDFNGNAQHEGAVHQSTNHLSAAPAEGGFVAGCSISQNLEEEEIGG